MRFLGVALFCVLPRAGALQSVAEWTSPATLDQEDDSSDDVHVTFVLDCRPFNLWQHEMLFNSARLVGQRGPVTAIISGCGEKEKARLQERYASLNWPPQYTQYFVDLFNDAKSIWLSKPLGFQQWYNNAGPQRDVVAVLDPDFIFVTPLTAKLDTNALPLDWEGPVPSRVQKGVIAAQRYLTFRPEQRLNGNGHRDLTPFTAWGFPDGAGNMTGVEFLIWACSGDPNGESGCKGLTMYELGTYHSSGVPYIAHRDDWDWLAIEWVAITERLHMYAPRGYTVDMYSWSLATAHRGLRQFILSNLMLSDYNMPDVAENWTGIDASNVDVCSDSLEEILPEVRRHVPNFVHYCHAIRAPWDSFKSQDNGAIFSKYWFDWGLPSGQPHALERCEQTERSPNVGGYPALRWIKSAAPKLSESMPTIEKRARFLGCTVKAFLKSAIQVSCPGQPLAKDVLEERDMEDVNKRTPVMDLMMNPLREALRRHPKYSGEVLQKDEYLGEISIRQGMSQSVLMTVTKSRSGSPELQTVAEELKSWNISHEEAFKIFEDAGGVQESDVITTEAPVHYAA